MREIYLGFKLAFSYFSIIPMKFRKKDNLSRKKVILFMLFFFPLVGAVLALISIQIFELTGRGWYSALLAAVLYLALYGFIHLEAFIDTIDALYGAHSGKDAYKIIKDPVIGAMGMLFGIALFVLKVAAIALLLLNDLTCEFAVIVIVSRFSLLIIIKNYPLHKRSSFALLMKDSLSNMLIVAAIIFYGIFGFILMDSNFMFIFAAGIIIAYLAAKMLRKRLGFINGDVLGSSIEIIEVTLLTVVALIWV